jgi:hypothetical protein
MPVRVKLFSSDGRQWGSKKFAKVNHCLGEGKQSRGVVIGAKRDNSRTRLEKRSVVIRSGILFLLMAES